MEAIEADTIYIKFLTNKISAGCEYYPKAEADAEIARLEAELAAHLEAIEKLNKTSISVELYDAVVADNKLILESRAKASLEIIDLSEKLARLVEASRGWHNSEDCRVEERTDCALCKAIASAKE